MRRRRRSGSLRRFRTKEFRPHFDHFAYDAAQGRPFATLLQQRIVQVVDTKTGKNGIYVPQVGRFFVGVPDHAPAPILVFDVAKP
jgi:hypothetical protein